MPPPRGEEQEVSRIQSHARRLVRHRVPKQRERCFGGLCVVWCRGKHIYSRSIAHERAGRVGCWVVASISTGRGREIGIHGCGNARWCKPDGLATDYLYCGEMTFRVIMFAARKLTIAIEEGVL
jgi:hypothetical protein